MGCLLSSLVAIAQQDYIDICIACMTTYRCMGWATDCSINHCITECSLSDCICLDCLTPALLGGNHLCAQQISDWSSVCCGIDCIVDCIFTAHLPHLFSRVYRAGVNAGLLCFRNRFQSHRIAQVFASALIAYEPAFASTAQLTSVVGIV